MLYPKCATNSLLLFAMAAAGGPLAWGQASSAPPHREGRNEPPGSFRAAADMHVGREYPGGVLLQDGRVLAVSGHPVNGQSIASAELYDFRTGQWQVTGSLARARNGGNGATLLTDGRVLLAGDHNNTEGALHSAEIYDPKTGQWTETGELNTARGVHSCTLLRDGRVLMAGGIDWGTETVWKSAELFNPKTGRFSETGALAEPRFAHGAVLLKNGHVLITGGIGSWPGTQLSTTERYDPRKGEWQAAASMHDARRGGFGLVALHDGRVLAVGGRQETEEGRNTYLATAELYDPDRDNWMKTGSMATPRGNIVATVLRDGRVLVAGGTANGFLEIRSAEIYEPATGQWHAAGQMSTPRRNHRATLLRDGTVLIIGGSNLGGGNYLKRVELFTPTDR